MVNKAWLIPGFTFLNYVMSAPIQYNTRYYIPNGLWKKAVLAIRNIATLFMNNSIDMSIIELSDVPETLIKRSRYILPSFKFYIAV